MRFSGFSKRMTIITCSCLAFVILLFAFNPLISKIVGSLAESKLEEKLDAEIEIAALRLNLFTGHASLEGFQLTYTQSNGNRLSIKSQLLDTKLKLPPIHNINLPERNFVLLLWLCLVLFLFPLTFFAPKVKNLLAAVNYSYSFAFGFPLIADLGLA